jgi:hypothetical protein
MLKDLMAKVSSCGSKMQVMFQRKNLVDFVSSLEDKLNLTIGGDVVIVALKITTTTNWEKATIKPLVFLPSD